MKPTLTIGLSCTPSKIIEHSKKFAVKVILSYGGGMGGSSETIYASKIMHTKDNMIDVYYFDSKRVRTVNPRYVVSTETVSLIKVVNDITAHTNYHSKNCTKDILTEYYLLYDDETYDVNLVDYVSDTFMISQRKVMSKHDTT